MSQTTAVYVSEVNKTFSKIFLNCGRKTSIDMLDQTQISPTQMDYYVLMSNVSGWEGHRSRVRVQNTFISLYFLTWHFMSAGFSI